MEPLIVSRQPTCPDARTLLEFALGKLSAAATEGVRAHLAGCEDCSQTVEKLKSDPASADATGNKLDGHTASLVSDRFEKDYTKASEKELTGHLGSCIRS